MLKEMPVKIIVFHNSTHDKYCYEWNIACIVIYIYICYYRILLSSSVVNTTVAGGPKIWLVYAATVQL